MVNVYPTASRGGIHRQASTTSTISRGSYGGVTSVASKRPKKLSQRRQSSFLGNILGPAFDLPAVESDPYAEPANFTE